MQLWPKSIFFSVITLLISIQRMPAHTPVKKTTAKKTASRTTSIYRLEQLSYEKLVNLVDSVLDLDQINQQLLSELNKAIELKQQNSSAVCNLPVKDFITEHWDHVKMNPYPKNIPLSTTIKFIKEQNNFSLPVSGKITSPFGWRDKRNHYGLDLDLQYGTPVRCTFKGVVRFARYYKGYGNLVIVRHSNGLETFYAHFSRIKVKEGQHINAGQVIGLGGNTGNSRGTHVHFEIRYQGLPINPAQVISFAETSLKADSLKLQKRGWYYAAIPLGKNYHIVKKGESLASITYQYGITKMEICRLNNLHSRAILRIGQVIKLS